MINDHIVQRRSGVDRRKKTDRRSGFDRRNGGYSNGLDENGQEIIYQYDLVNGVDTLVSHASTGAAVTSTG